MKRIKTPVCIITVILLFPLFSNAQISVSPVNLFINNRTGLGNLYISNPGEVSREVQITFDFGYAASDTLGDILMVYDDTIAAADYDLGGYIRIFPRSFILGPGEQQTVRFQVTPLTNKPDGMYWTRAVITSGMTVNDLEMEMLSESVGAKINYVFRQNIPVFYGKNQLKTGIAVKNIRTSADQDQLVVLLSLERTGNSPWNGTVTAELLGAGGNVIVSKKQTSVVYFNTFRRLEIGYDEIPSEILLHRLKLIFETSRNDIPSEDLVQAEPMIYEKELNLTIHH